LGRLRNSLTLSSYLISPFRSIYCRITKNLLVHCRRQSTLKLRQLHSKLTPSLYTMIHAIGVWMHRSSKMSCYRHAGFLAPSLRKMEMRLCPTMATNRMDSRLFTSPIPISCGHQNILFPDWVKAGFVKHLRVSGRQSPAGQ
jgi:hypothetical protein